MYNRLLYSREATGRWSLRYSHPYIGPLFSSLEAAKKRAEQDIVKDKPSDKEWSWDQGTIPGYIPKETDWNVNIDPGEHGIWYQVMALEVMD
jgi:hypothetical protein